MRPSATDMAQREWNEGDHRPRLEIVSSRIHGLEKKCLQSDTSHLVDWMGIDNVIAIYFGSLKLVAWSVTMFTELWVNSSKSAFGMPSVHGR